MSTRGMLHPALRAALYDDDFESAEQAYINVLMRERPLSHTDASIVRESIERTNRETRDRLRARRGAVVFSTLD